MAKIGFLGLGMMGSGMASCLVEAGHHVTVWNCSPGKARALVSQGAQEAATPYQAARGADAVFSMVADDAASDACWLGAAGAVASLAPGAFVIECSTISHGHSAKLAATAQQTALRYIDCQSTVRRARPPRAR